jgi:NitT/TauT family transport system permease protein
MRSLFKGWFRVREDLSPGRQTFLTVLSFLVPIAVWCFVSYTPWIWHPDIELDVSAERVGITTVYVAGDHLSREFFPGFQQAVRDENSAIVESRSTSDEPAEPSRSARRSNQRVLRQLASVAIENGWLPRDDRENDALIYEVWRDIATGKKKAIAPALSDENFKIVRSNWAILEAKSPDFDAAELPDEPLLKLVPQGIPANPVYLPPPHKVITTGWRDLTSPPREGTPSMRERLIQSVRIIFLGFLVSCLIGVPLGILCGTFDTFSRPFEPFVDFFRYMPAPTFSTLLVAIFLAYDAPKIALVFIGTFFQLVLVISKTTRLLDGSLLEAAQTLGARPNQLVIRVVVPGIMPELYNDLRILLGWSWTWLVIAELIGVKTGLTEFIETQGRFRNFDRVFPIIIMIGVIGFCTDQILAWLRGIIFPWTGHVGPFSRAVARTLFWVPSTILEGARERAASMPTSRHDR